MGVSPGWGGVRGTEAGYPCFGANPSVLSSQGQSLGEAMGPHVKVGQLLSPEVMRGGGRAVVTGLLAELAFALPTQEDDDAHGAQDPSTDDSAHLEAVPVVVEGTVFIFRVIGIQGRQAY